MKNKSQIWNSTTSGYQSIDTSANVNNFERNYSLGYCHSSLDASVLSLEGWGEREIKSTRNDEKEKRVLRNRSSLVTQRWGERCVKRQKWLCGTIPDCVISNKYFALQLDKTKLFAASKLTHKPLAWWISLKVPEFSSRFVKVSHGPSLRARNERSLRYTHFPLQLCAIEPSRRKDIITPSPWQKDFNESCVPSPGSQGLELACGLQQFFVVELRITTETTSVKKTKTHLYNFKKAIKSCKAFLSQHNVRNRNNHLYEPIRKCECYSTFIVSVIPSSTSFPDPFPRRSHFEVKTLGTSLRFLLLPRKPSV